MTKVELHGYEEFVSCNEALNPDGPPVLLYFTGEKLPSGKSWCIDCVEVTCSVMTIKMEGLQNYAQFTEFIDKLPSKGPKVFFFFTGKKKDNGHSWCIYCQLAEPVVMAYLNELNKDIIFAYVDVGDRDTWKDKACPFRTDPRLKLMVIPTIIRWHGVQRLEGSQCNKRELLDMLFDDED